MARVREQFQSGDVMFWAVFALAAWAVALLGGVLAGVIPSGVLAGLHASRLEGADLALLRGQMQQLQSQAAELRQENAVLLQRFMLNEQQSGDVTRRVGALEVAMPKVIESLNSGAGLDRSVMTGSISPGPATSFEAEGGSVTYTRTPLPDAAASSAVAAQPMPQKVPDQVVPNPASFGIALGPPIAASEAQEAWNGMNSRVGTLLVGLAPLLGHVEGGSGRRLMAGPIATEAAARELCGRMAKVGIACASVPFIGDPLTLAN